MKLLYPLMAVALAQKRSLSEMSEKRKLRQMLKLKQANQASTTTTETTTTTTTSTTMATTTTTKPATKQKLKKRVTKKPKGRIAAKDTVTQAQQRAKVTKYIGTIGERLEESLQNGFVAAEFGGRALQHCFSCGK